MIFTKPAYYDSIKTCPLIRWQEVKETGKLKPLHIKGKFSFTRAKEAYYGIAKELFEESGGVSDERKIYYREVSSALYRLVMSYETGDRSARQIAEMDIAAAELYIDVPLVKFSHEIGLVSKAMGFRIDPNEVTIAEYIGFQHAIKMMNHG